MAKINESCRLRAKYKNLPEPKIVGGHCTLCGSMSREDLKFYLSEGAEAKWLEPASGQPVTQLELNDGTRVNLHHLCDKPFDEVEYDKTIDLIEETAGSLQVFLKELNKYFE